ncbi:MAG: HAD family hydrolase [Acholeplasmataceae bacterium]
MKYLIACDLDGSLLNDLSEISDLSKKVLRHLEDLGHAIIIATGRPYSGAIDKYMELNLSTPLITDNGGTIENPMDPNYPKTRSYIPLHIMHDLFLFSKPFLVSALYSTKSTIYAYKYDRRLEMYFSGSFSDNVIEKDLTEFEVEPSSLIFLVDVNHKEKLEDYIDSKYSKMIAYRLWGTDRKYGIYEIYVKHVSKASAIKQVQHSLGFENKQVIAIGDGINDVEMIHESNWGVAMKNAVSPVKQVANAITKENNNDDGLAKYLVEFFKLKLEGEKK